MRNQLAQLLLLELPEAAWNRSLEQRLERLEPSGLLLRSFTTAASAAQLATTMAHILPGTPFLAADWEGRGGPSDWLARLPPAEKVAQQGLAAVERLGDLLGTAMELLGLNLYFGPTLDLPAAFPNALGGDTLDSPAEIARRIEPLLRGLARHRILACGRHFPGLPAPANEPARDLPVVAKSMATLWREDLIPYRMLGDKLALILVTHAAHKAYDYEFLRPASLSAAVVEGLLREKLSYRGVALADASAAAGAARIEPGEAAVQALAAGCDLVLVSGEQKPLAEVFYALERALESGRLRRERVEQALDRIKNAKRSLAFPRRGFSDQALATLARKFEDFGAQYRAEEQTIG